jgi:hypothetical protein
VIGRLDRALDTLLTAREPNAAGRLGLFRIVYAAFYLWNHATTRTDIALIGFLPAEAWKPVGITRLLLVPPHLETLLLLERLLLCSLVLLCFGLGTRLATATVLITGTCVAAVDYSFGQIDHADTFLVTYVPLVMLFARWGDTWSLDASLGWRKPISPLDDRWQYAAPCKVILLWISVLYFTSGLYKIVYGSWLVDWDTLARALIQANVRPDASQSAAHIAQSPLLSGGLQVSALLLELSFPLALTGERLRTIFLSAMALYHFSIWRLMGIDFAALLVVPAAFVNWHTLFGHIATHVAPSFRNVNVIAGAAASMATVALVAPTYLLEGFRTLSPSMVWAAAAIASLVGLVSQFHPPKRKGHTP